MNIRIEQDANKQDYWNDGKNEVRTGTTYSEKDDKTSIDEMLLTWVLFKNPHFKSSKLDQL